VALELAVTRPELVERLVLIAPSLPGWDWSPQTRNGWAEEEAAYERGDWSAAAEASLRLWLDGPSRSPDAVEPTVRTAVREMILRSYEIQTNADAGAREDAVVDPPVSEQLEKISCPTLVIVGNDDIADMHAIGRHVATVVPGARLMHVPGAHLPSLERPDEINARILAFIRES
jgi:3-oxoadipate enol-lactonase